MIKKYKLQADYTDDFNPSCWWCSPDTTYDDLAENQILQLIEGCDFDVWVIENKFKKRYFVKDLQEANNFGNIESETFCSILEIAERLQDTYFDDFYGGKECICLKIINPNHPGYVELEKGVELIYNDELYTITQYVEEAEMDYGLVLYELEREISDTQSEVIYMTDFEIRHQCKLAE